MLSRGIENDIIGTCRELGIAITAYGVLSRGLIGAPKQQYGPGDLRAVSPRFQGDNLARNLELVASLEPIASRHGLTIAQLAIAWVVAQGRDVVPLVRMRTVSRVQWPSTRWRPPSAPKTWPTSTAPYPPALPQERATPRPS